MRQDHLGWTGVVLTLVATAVSGCHFPISPEVVYKPAAPERKPVRAPKRNDLSLGIRKLEVLPLVTGDELDREAIDADDLGFRFAEAIRDTLVFKEVHYPLRDEDVDVVFEPVVRADLAKNRLTNALKVLPGLVLPWIDGLGFDYDYQVVVEVHVRNARQQGALTDKLEGASDMTAERYPSILWFLGLHVGLAILTIFESVTTDQVVLERLLEWSADSAWRPVLEGVAHDFSPTAKPCPDHPAELQPGRYCIIDGRDLFYPILYRGEARPPGP